MFKLQFPDSSIREYEYGITPLDIASTISKSLAKTILVAKLDDIAIDINRRIDTSLIAENNTRAIQFLTIKDAETLEYIRHDTAHVMAQAVKELFPETQVTIGPAIENGFYYDFYRQDKPFTADDLPIIEKRMQQIIKRNDKIIRQEWQRDEAIAFFKQQGEYYKAEIIDGIATEATITLYQQGDFIDLCRGPHLPSTAKIGGYFKLMKLAGAYWRGDSNNVMLQRIYGTAWATKQQLDDHLTMLAEAEKRDHRKLGKAMGLFHFQEEAPGSIFWHTKGWQVFSALKQYVLAEMHQDGYEEVATPQMLDSTFWQKSGHWDKFGENMFVAEVEKRTFAIKPMNCPGHVQIFKQGNRSYRQLPIRYAEFTTLHRNEPSGSLHGLMRLRSFHQDDAHIFCMEEQINDEAIKFCNLLKRMYAKFGFDDIIIKFSDRPEKRAGSDADWDKAEKALEQAAKASGLEYSLNKGEGAFYGPKLEFVLRDAIGRDWQCGTLQCDFILPQRLNARYVDNEGNKQYPVILHRAALGSLERFLGILLEHTAGKLPLFLASTQVVIATVIDAVDDYATSCYQQLIKMGVRAELDLRNEKISYKVREHSHAKVPYIFVVGAKEAESNNITLRELGSRATKVMPFSEAQALFVATS